MNDHLELVLAGLQFSVRAPAGVDLFERDPLYAQFLAPDQPFDAEFSARLSLERAPEISGLPILFDTDETWAAYTDDRDVILRLRTEGGRDPYLWQVRIAGGGDGLGFEGVTVHCGDRMLQLRGDAPPILANPLHYPLDQLLLMFALPAYDGILVHASGVSRGGRGLFLAGKSGAGKTTFMRQCAGRSDLFGLSDDRVVVRRRGGELRLFGTPWAGEGQVAAAADSAFSAMAFLHHGDRNEVRPLSPVAALHQLLPTASILWFDRERVEAVMSLCEQIVQAVPCYEVHFLPDPTAADLLDEIL